MRVKHLLAHLNLRARARLVWARITFSRLTTAYFVLAVIHCLVQVSIQGQAFAANSSAAVGLFNLLKQANDTGEMKGFAILGDDLRVCFSLTQTVTMSNPSCQVVWRPQDMANSANTALGRESLLAVSPSTTGSSLSPASATVPQAETSSASSNTTSSISSVTTAVVETSSTQAASISTATIQSSSLRAPSAVTVSLSPGTKVATVTTTSTAVTTAVVVQPSAAIRVSSTTSTKLSEDNRNSDNGVGPALSEIVQKLTASSKRHLEVAGFLDKNEQSANTTGLAQVMSNTSATLSNGCIQTLLWPAQKLSNTQREDATLIGFQVSVLGMSIVALLNESIPHILAALFTQLVATAWTVYQVFQTEDFREDFFRLTVNGACPGNNLLGSYWQERKQAEIASAVLNIVSFLVTAFLTYKLTHTYGWQTFKRVGASIKINRMYKLVLSLTIAIQLSLFFIVAAAALWLDQLCNGSVGRLATLGTVYRIGIIIMFILLVPWLTLGWFAIRREMRKSCLAFLGLSIVFIGLWAAMFDAISFRWTFMLWPFFAVMAVVSGALMVSTFILGLVCRLNFGKGLPHYLSFQEPLDGVDFTPVYPDDGKSDPEKVDYPSAERPVPIFSVAFGSGDDTARPADMRPNSSHSVDGIIIQQPGLGNPNMRSLSITTDSSMVAQAHLARSDSASTSHSMDSATSSDSNRSRRWMIE